MSTPVTTRKRRCGRQAPLARAVPEPAGERPDAPQREQPAGVVARRVLLGERGDADLEHAERDRRQREREHEHAASPASRARPRGACRARAAPAASAASTGEAATPSPPAAWNATPVRKATSGEIAVAMPAASSGPEMNTSSSRSASSANAVSSRSRPTRLGQQRAQRGGDRRDAEPGHERQHGDQRRARALEHRDHEDRRR